MVYHHALACIKLRNDESYIYGLSLNNTVYRINSLDGTSEVIKNNIKLIINNGNEIIYSSSTYFCKDTEVYAKWLSKLTITLVFEDGTQEEQYIYEGETIESINYRIGSGQYLGGVYFDEALTKKLTNSQLSKYKPKGDITLYVVRKSY